MAGKQRFRLFRNDRTTAGDECVLALIILMSAAFGTAVFIKAPSFWFISRVISKGFGIMWIMLAVMMFPMLIYRLLTNEKPDRQKKD